MKKTRKNKSARDLERRVDRAEETYEGALHELSDVFPPLGYFLHGMHRSWLAWGTKGSWLVVDDRAGLLLNMDRFLQGEGHAYVVAHGALHLALGHTKPRAVSLPEWAAACDVVVARFLDGLAGLFPPPGFRLPPLEAFKDDVDELYQRFVAEGIPPACRGCGTAVLGHPDLRGAERAPDEKRPRDWEERFAEALRYCISESLHFTRSLRSRWEEIDVALLELTEIIEDKLNSTFPLLGGLLSTMRIVAEATRCTRLGIRVAAVDPARRRIYLNPLHLKSVDEFVFVLAHELLHVGLRHEVRAQWRDPFLWNVACDFVINGWLVEMGIGEMPKLGCLYDPSLKGLSAEEIYDRIVANVAWRRRLGTFRGQGVGDILPPPSPEWWKSTEGVRLDDFYREVLRAQWDLERHRRRGYLPAGLVEEIESLSHPPIPWDVALARWFDTHVRMPEKRRTYARPSRRQWATPHIPRPRWYTPEEIQKAHTFGVVLDTSGSMDERTLGKAVGAIAAYAMNREVPAVRLVYADAAVYDEGYVPPDQLLHTVRIRGRGGTVLAPAIAYLESADDFPEEAPILVITDGFCDRLVVHREHAFLIPPGGQLPFSPKGPVFRIT
jgi:predicted metal-dependent peptidase